MTLLAPPPRAWITADVFVGGVVFASLGCASCHVPALKTGPHRIRALSHQTFYPYSDFLLHDMGSLGDGIEQGQAKGREMRTAPLWGLRAIKTFLHDGRAASIKEAILAHDGQARAAGIDSACSTPRHEGSCSPSSTRSEPGGAIVRSRSAQRCGFSPLPARRRRCEAARCARRNPSTSRRAACRSPARPCCAASTLSSRIARRRRVAASR